MEVQFSNERAALMIYSDKNLCVHDCNVLVYDLPSGQQILNCNEDLNFRCDVPFVLTKSRIVMIHDQTVYCATFWV